MEGWNQVTLMGNLGADPELRMTQGGTAVLNMRVACTTSFGKGEERKERTEWFTVVVWNRQAEALAKFLSKGAAVFVSGRLETRSYQDRDGNKRYSTEIVADRVIVPGRGGGRPEQRREEPREQQGDSWGLGDGEGDTSFP